MNYHYCQQQNPNPAPGIYLIGLSTTLASIMAVTFYAVWNVTFLFPDGFRDRRYVLVADFEAFNCHTPMKFEASYNP